MNAKPFLALGHGICTGKIEASRAPRPREPQIQVSAGLGPPVVLVRREPAKKVVTSYSGLNEVL